MSNIDRKEPGTTSRSGDEFDLLEFVHVVWRSRGLIVGTLVVVLSVTFTILMVRPKIYEATATLLAPRETGASGLFSGLALPGLPQQGGLGLSLPSLTPNRDMLVSILKSRTMARAVVNRFDLRERYRVPYLEDAVRVLQESTSVLASREGVVSVRVEDREPTLAAAMANFYVD